MKILSHKVSFFVGVLLVTFCLTDCNNHSEGKSYSKKTYQLEDIEIARLQAGDLILRRGYGMLSDGIAKVLQGKYKVTHIGVVDFIYGEPVVYHAISRDNQDGIVVDKLNRFVGDSYPNSISIVRLRRDSLTRKRFLDRIGYYRKLDLPFDMSFDIRTKKEVYCTELVRNALMDATGQDYFTDRVEILDKELLRFDPVFDTVHFEMIIFPEKKSN